MINSKAKWIWIDQESKNGTYGDFVCDFFLKKQKNITLRIAVDTEYAAYINGQIVAFGQYSDFPQKRFYDTVCIGKFCKEGRNRLAIQVFFSGNTECFTSYPKFPGLIFDLSCDEEIVALSDDRVLSRKSVDYLSDYTVVITPQIGYGYSCKLDCLNDWKNTDGNVSDFKNSVLVCAQSAFAARPIKKLVLMPPSETKTVKCGTFELNGGDTPAQKMMCAKRLENLSVCKSAEKTMYRAQSDGIYFIEDLGEETVGYLDFIVETEKETIMWVAFGEHIDDGFVRGSIWIREFCLPFVLLPGKHDFTGFFRRLGARYLEVFAFTDKIAVKRMTLRSAVYPAEKREYVAPNEYFQRLYDVAVHTLECCMHEHYEDCPWREQSLYTLDSRLQMLAGYNVFCDASFARSAIELMASDPRDDGLLSICFPSANGLVIPSFVLHFVIQVYEYYVHTEDKALVCSVKDRILKIMNFFRSKKENGLIKTFRGEKIWNFYEWTHGLDGKRAAPNNGADFELVLNEVYLIALDSCLKMSVIVGEEFFFESEIGEVQRAVYEKFYDKDKGLFRSYCDEDHFSELGNVLAVLSETVTGDEAIKLLRRVFRNENVVKSSLSMKSFTYFAMLKASRKEFGKAVIESICEIYGKMIALGATTFWETEKGAEDFARAGSLCHGWSTAPAIFFPLLDEELRLAALSGVFPEVDSGIK